jgi:phytoene dehydrogenase-like protein
MSGRSKEVNSNGKTIFVAGLAPRAFRVSRYWRLIVFVSTVLATSPQTENHQTLELRHDADGVRQEEDQQEQEQEDEEEDQRCLHCGIPSVTDPPRLPGVPRGLLRLG